MTVANIVRSSRVAAAAGLLLGLSALSTQAQLSLTTGQFAVNDAGAATYSIPLTVAPGVGGFQPSLTLQYSSQAPNGVFGVGWTLSGVSSITRCAKSPAEEGERAGVKNDASDIFCLDGQKLRAVSGNYGAAGTRYRTALDSYGRITSQGNASGGPLTFTLEAKSGEIYTFGGSDSSRLEHPSKGVVRTWMVSEIKDRFENRITFTYNKNLSLGEQLLSQVEYSNGRLQINYEARPGNDRILKYDDGVQFGSTNSRVISIDVAHKPMVNGTATLTNFKSFQFQYSQSQASQRSMLRSIRECAADGNCLPATALAYRDGTPGVFQKTGSHGYPYSSSKGFGVQDQGGNGKQSIYSYRDDASYRDLALWDVDGDGRTDLLSMRFPQYDGDSPATQFVQYANGAISSALLNQSYYTACFADLNGDGLSEEIKFRGDTQSEGVNYYSVQETLTNTSVGLGQNALVSCKSMDFDGDGRAEIVVYNSSKASYLLTYKTGALSLLTTPLPVGKTAAFVGDFNGDGKTDLSESNATSYAAVPTYLSIGQGSEKVSSWSTSFAGLAGGVACAGDFNGDGRTDLLAGANQLYLSNGNVATMVSQNALSGLSQFIVCGDFNGDGLMDVAITHEYWYNALPADVDRLSSVDNGVGFVQRMEYKPITDSSVYAKGSGSAYPKIDMQTPIMVVSRVQSGNDAQGWQSTSYRYAGLRADLKRNGTQGFERVTSTNENTGVSVATYYNQSYPLTGLRSRVLKFLGSEASPQALEDKTYSYAQRGIGTPNPTAQAAQVLLSQSETTQFDLGQSGLKIGSVKDITDSFDAYGFPLRQRTERYDGSGVLTSTSTSENTYSHQDATWLLGQLVRTNTAAQNLRALPTTTSVSNALSAQVNPSSVQATLTTPGTWSASLSATASGGVGTYNYSWTNPSGTRVSVSEANTPNPTLLAALGWNESIAERVRLTVTDSAGTAVTRDVDVELTSPPVAADPIAIQASPAAIQKQAGSAGVLSASVTASASGGYGTLSYGWTRVSGNRTSVSSTTSRTPVFSANLNWGESVNEAYLLSVTDTVGTVATQTYSVSFSVVSGLTANLSPAGNASTAYSTRWRTRFHADGGQCSSVMADTVPR